MEQNNSNQERQTVAYSELAEKEKWVFARWTREDLVREDGSISSEMKVIVAQHLNKLAKEGNIEALQDLLTLIRANDPTAFNLAPYTLKEIFSSDNSTPEQKHLIWINKDMVVQEVHLSNIRKRIDDYGFTEEVDELYSESHTFYEIIKPFLNSLYHEERGTNLKPLGSLLTVLSIVGCCFIVFTSSETQMQNSSSQNISSASFGILLSIILFLLGVLLTVYSSITAKIKMKREIQMKEKRIMDWLNKKPM